MEQEFFTNVSNKDTNSEIASVSNNIFLLQTVDQQSYRDSLHGRALTTLFGNILPDSCNRNMEKSFLIQTPALPFENRPRSTDHSDWIFIILCSFLLLLSFIKVKILKMTRMSYKLLINRIYNQNDSKSELSYPYFSIFPFTMCSWIAFSLVLYVFICQLIGYNDNIFLFWSFGFGLIFFIIRFFLLKLVGILFDMEYIMSEIKYMTGIINFVIAFLSFPFICVNYYYSFPFCLILVMLIFVLLSCYRIRLGWDFLKQKFRIHEYFLYLCTIEILPLLLLLKFISNKLLVF
ncbi:MAG: DUF4271 domain-containing protein [Bacteroidales bacterium]|jgi:hypothetical protein|nr:DUF4271 domain-containing protein [Bacteroidales bacterium]